MTEALKEMREVAHRLLILLKDPSPGLSTWVQSVAWHVKKLNELTGEVDKPRSQRIGDLEFKVTDQGSIRFRLADDQFAALLMALAYPGLLHDTDRSGVAELLMEAIRKALENAT